MGLLGGFAWLMECSKLLTQAKTDYWKAYLDIDDASNPKNRRRWPISTMELIRRAKSLTEFGAYIEQDLEYNIDWREHLAGWHFEEK